MGPQNGAVIHVRHDGHSRDVPLTYLDVTPGVTDQAIKQALARFLDLPEIALQNYVLDRHQTGNLTLRPEAVFG